MAKSNSLFQMRCSVYSENSIPNWMSKSNGLIKGVPLESDIGCHVITCVNHTSTSKIFNISVQVNSSVSKPHLCKRRWPTTAAIVLNTEVGKLSGLERDLLIHRLHHLIPNQTDLQAFQLFENVDNFIKSFFILASGPGNVRSVESNAAGVISWQIGCGAISQSHLRNLQFLEKAAVTGDLSQSLGGYPIKLWFVGDEKPSYYGNFESSNNLVGTFGYSSGNNKRLRREVAGRRRSERSLGSMPYELAMGIDGSGQSTIHDKSESTPITDVFKSTSPGKSIATVTTVPPPTSTRKSVSKGMPIAGNRILNISATLGSIINYRIPNDAFYDKEDGTNMTYQLKNGSAIITRSLDKSWIAFSSRLIQIRPSIFNLGEHKLTLCAFDRDDNRVCKPVIIMVESFIHKQNILVIEISPGRLWFRDLYKGFGFLKDYSKVKNIDFTVLKSPYPYSIDSDGKFQVITEAFHRNNGIEISINATFRQFHLTNITFRLVTKDNFTMSNTVRSRPYRVKFRRENYSFSEVDSLMNKMASLLSERAVINSGKIESRHLFIVKLWKLKSIINGQSNGSDTLDFSWVYMKRTNLSDFHQVKSNCEEVQLKNVISVLKSSQSAFSPFKLLFADVTDDPGLCSTYFTSTTATIPTTTPMQITSTASQPTEVNINVKEIISDFKVTAGIPFLRTFEVPDEFVSFVELLDSGNRSIDRNYWIQLKDQTHLYGLALKQHVIDENYNFVLRMRLKGSTDRYKDARFSVFVEDKAQSSKVREKIEWNHEITLEFDYLRSGLKVDSLELRWEVSQLLGQYFDSKCLAQCVVIKDVLPIENYKSRFRAIWGLHSLMSTKSQCPKTELKSLISKILPALRADEKIPTNSFQQPSTNLSEFILKGSKKVLKLQQVMIKLDKCYNTTEQTTPSTPSSPLSDKNIVQDIVLYRGYPYVQTIHLPRNIGSNGMKLLRNDTKKEVKDSFIRLLPDELKLQALIISNDVRIKEKSYHYLLCINAENRMLLPLKVDVEPSHKTPHPQPNHKVELLIRIGKNITSALLNDLQFRWILVKTLHEYLEPNCHHFCGTDIHLSYIQPTSSVNEFVAEWSQKSIYAPESSSGKNIGSCDKEKLRDLKNRLMGTDGFMVKPLPRFRSYMNIIGRVVTVKFTELGTCLYGEASKTGSDKKYTPPNGVINRPENREDNQRTFLLTTVVPACALIILALLVALIVACVLHNTSCRMCAAVASPAATNYINYEYQNKGVPVIFAEELEDRCSPPSRPLILPNEKPPLPPPDYNNDESLPAQGSTYPNNRSPNRMVSPAGSPYLRNGMYQFPLLPTEPPASSSYYPDPNNQQQMRVVAGGMPAMSQHHAMPNSSLAGYHS